MAQLIIELPDDVAQQAEAYARKTGHSLAELVIDILVGLTAMDSEADLSPQVQKLLGCVSLPNGVDYKDVLMEALWKKYGFSDDEVGINNS